MAINSPTKNDNKAEKSRVSTTNPIRNRMVTIIRTVKKVRSSGSACSFARVNDNSGWFVK